MPFLMVPIVHDANLELDFKMEAAELPQTTENMALKVKVKGLGEQRVSLNTENLVKKTAAFALIQQVSENMGTAFAPYVEQLLPIIVQNTSFDHSKQIKKLALKSFTNMLVAVGEPKNIELNQNIFAQYTQSLEKALARHDENSAKIMVKALANNLRALNKHNTQRRDFLTQAQIESLGPLLKATCDLVASVKSATKIVLSQTKKNFEMDEEDVERIKEDLAKMTTVTTQVMELTGQLVEIFKTGAEQTVRTGAFSYFASILSDYNSVTEDEVIDALCFFCDFIEHTSYDTPTVV